MSIVGVKCPECDIAPYKTPPWLIKHLEKKHEWNHDKAVDFANNSTFPSASDAVSDIGSVADSLQSQMEDMSHTIEALVILIQVFMIPIL